ncbi:MAG: aminopeptidase [Candidatus Krumholzibacteriales bacterium]
MNRLQKAARKAVNDCLKLRKGENLLLVTDRKKMQIAEAIAYYAGEKGGQVTTYLMTETLRPITEPTDIFKTMMRKADATMYMLDARVEEKPFRGYMVANGTRRKGRIIMMPGITRNMMERLVNIDYRKMNSLTGKVIRKLKDCEEVHVTNPLGTDITFSVKGRNWENDNGMIDKAGMHGNLPAGECYTCPVESTFTGKLVISLIDDKKGRGTMVFEKGKMVDYKGRGVRAIVDTIGKDPSGYIIGEFGIGTNKGARICRNMLEAEKAFGTVHFAIGDSYGLGKNKSKWHFDGLVEKVTLTAGRKQIIKNGKFLVK